ncbi:MAG: hypothetical protein U9Q70_04440 [Chloroflexota bacterium]|nr:hypothetical protein [Chloroflexota bacterium]
MLRVDKPSLTQVLKARLKHYQDKVNDGGYSVSQAWKNFTQTEGRHKKLNQPTVRALLAQTFHYKCAYCENRTPARGNPIEHYEPKKSKPNKMFAWDNLLWACVTCNTGAKGRKMDYDAQGNPLLLNPCKPEDDPLSFLEISIAPQEVPPLLRGLGHMSGRDGLTPDKQARASYTIVELGLNLEKLPSDRAKSIRLFLRNISGLFNPEQGPDFRAQSGMLPIRESLAKQLDPTTPHLAAIRQILYCEPAYIANFYDTENYQCLLHALLETLPELRPSSDVWALRPADLSILAPKVRDWLEEQ